MAMLTLRESARLIDRYRLPPLLGTLAETREDVLRCASAVEGPVAVKAISLTQTHKAKAGLVMLNLVGDEHIIRACDHLRQAAPGEEFECFLVQPMVTGGIELFLGALVDPQFGALVALGPGGSLVELVGAVDFLRPPAGEGQARAFVQRNAISRLLRNDGTMAASRGDDHSRSRKSPIDLVTAAVVGMARLITECVDTVSSIDINPLVLLPERPELVTLDLRMEGGGGSVRD